MEPADWRSDVEGVTPLTDAPDGCDTDFFTAARTWLADLDVGATVRWGQHHAHAAPDVHTSWVDVLVPEAQEATSTSWLVTIDAPDAAPDAADLGDLVETVVVPFDIGLCGRWDPHTMWWDLDTVSVLGSPPAVDTDGELSLVPAWSTAALCRALRRWAHLIAARGDVVWVYDTEMTSPAALAAEAALDAYLDGSDPGVDLDESGQLRAAGPAFDFLAEDPDRAAELLGALREKLDLE